MACQQVRQLLDQIMEQMPAISDLNGLWSPFLRRSGVLTPAVTADDFHFRMLLKPRADCVYRAIRQHIDGRVALQITNQRPVAQATLVGSGKRMALPPFPPLRTGRVSFLTSGSS